MKTFDLTINASDEGYEAIINDYARNMHQDRANCATLPDAYAWATQILISRGLISAGEFDAAQVAGFR